MADVTNLTVSPQNLNLRVGESRVLTITTNDTNWTHTVQPAGIVNFDKNSKTVTALAEGTVTITITAKYGTGASIQSVVTVNVEQLTTTLTVRPEISVLNIGESQVVKVETDAPDFTMVSENPDIVSVDKATLTILAIKSGDAKVKFEATRDNYKTKTVVFNISVSKEEGAPVKMMLVNQTTGRYTTIQTSNNKSTKDVVIKLPETNGTLITREELDASIKVINKPKITSPLNNATNVETPIQSTAYDAILGFQGTHTHTEWQIASDENFENILKSKKAVAALGHNMTEISPSVAMAKVWARVRYFSGDNSSLWSDPVTFTTALAGPAGPQALIKGDGATKGYFGELAYADCIQDSAPRDYFGNWATLKKIAANYNGENLYKDHNINSGDYLVNAPIGSQVHYNDKLYYAKKYLRFKDNTFQVEPGTDDSCWVLDTRETLDTPKRFVFNVGIGYNARPNKLQGNLDMKANDGADWHRDAYPDTDKPSTIPNYIYPWGMNAANSNTVPSAYDIPKCSWLKFVYKGKILYTPKLPLLASIAWNDMAKVHAVYGDRTMRIGSRLYYYRLLKEEEYRELLVGLTDGTLDSLNSSELALDVGTVTNCNIFKNSIKHVWLEDFREGTSRKVATLNGSNVVVSDKSPRSACGVYRPVLELIPEGEEPYNNLPDAPICYNEKFQYDKYTDTGYFGRIKAADFINGDTLCATIGYTAGTSYLPNYDWLKFYYHGQIVFMPMSPLRHTNSWVNMNDKNILYGCDLGGRGRTDIKIQGYTFSIEMPNIVHSTPRWNDDSWQDHAVLANGWEAWNTRGRVNLHSMVQDLYVRVTGKRIRNRDFMYSTNELTESGYWCNTSVDHEYACHQIGDNWTEIPMTDMVVRYCDGFNGTAFHGKYLYSYIGSDTSNNAWKDNLGNSTNTPDPWHLGVGRVSLDHVPSHSNAHWGLRASLFLRS